MKIDPLPDHLKRALAYVNLANLGGHEPRKGAIDEFATRTQPQPARSVSMGYSITTLMASTFRTQIDGEPVSVYMIELGWITLKENRRCKVTELGRAIIRGLQIADAQETDDGLILISPEDPLNYAVLTRHIAEAGAGLLYDPYFKEDMLRWLSTSTTISRVLIKQEDDIRNKLFAMYLEGIPEAENIEIRTTASDTLHDRGLLHEDGSVSLLGTSLTGIGKHFTTMVPLPDEAGTPLRERIEELWRGGEKIEPADPGLRQKLEDTQGRPRRRQQLGRLTN